jgi:hypothetical protein
MSIAYEEWAQEISGFGPDGLPVPPRFPILVIHVAARNLPKLDKLSESDPVCIFLIPDSTGLRQQARTEAIDNDPNPRWTTSFRTYFIFESEQPVQFDVYDADHGEPRKLIGHVRTTIAALAAHSGREWTIPLDGAIPQRHPCDLLVVVEEEPIHRTRVHGQLEALRTVKLRTFSRNRLYFVIEKATDGNDFVRLYRSATIKGYKVTWAPFQLSVEALCHGDLKRVIRIVVFNDCGRKPPVEVGLLLTSIEDLMGQGKSSMPLQSLNPRLSPSEVSMRSIQIVPAPDIFVYLRAGLQLNLIPAIDFTASNGDPSSESSLHYLCPDCLNQYQFCLRSVGDLFIVALAGKCASLTRLHFHCRLIMRIRASLVLKGLWKRTEECWRRSTFGFPRSLRR